MKLRKLKRLMGAETIRYCQEHHLEPKEYGNQIFNRLMNNWFALPKKERGRTRLALEKVNGIGQFET